MHAVSPFVQERDLGNTFQPLDTGVPLAGPHPVGIRPLRRHLNVVTHLQYSVGDSSAHAPRPLPVFRTVKDRMPYVLPRAPNRCAWVLPLGAMEEGS